MSEAAFLELFASYETAVRVAARSLGIARALAEAHRSGVQPPDGILEAYFATLERDEAHLVTLRAHAQQLRSDTRI